MFSTEVLLKSKLFNDLQPSYLQPIITQYFASNKSEIWP